MSMQFSPVNHQTFIKTVDVTKYGGQQRGPNGVGGGNGSIETNELQGILNDSKASKTDKDAAKWLLEKSDPKNKDSKTNFQTYDADGNGMLSADEAKKAIAAYNKSKIKPSNAGAGQTQNPFAMHQPNNTH